MNNEELTKYVYGRKWQLIFFHNSVNKVFFDKAKNEAFCINTSQKFSILGSLTNNFRIRGRFEFLIEYPEIKDENKEIYRIHWLQKSNPIQSNEETNLGFIPIHVLENNYPFQGLRLSSADTLTFIDGNKGS